MPGKPLSRTERRMKALIKKNPNAYAAVKKKKKKGTSHIK